MRSVGADRREAEGLARECGVHGDDEGCETYDEADGDGAGDPEDRSRGARCWSGQPRCYHVLSRDAGLRSVSAVSAARRGAA